MIEAPSPAVASVVGIPRSHRLNPLKAANLPQVAYPGEYAPAILHNLLPEAIRKKDFWIRSANAILRATIWFLEKHHPEHCSISHVVNMVLYKDYTARDEHDGHRRGVQ